VIIKQVFVISVRSIPVLRHADCLIQLKMNEQQSNKAQDGIRTRSFRQGGISSQLNYEGTLSYGIIQ